MKQYLLIVVAIALCSSVMFMGFQCSSAESTSAKLYMSRNDFASAEKSLMKEVEKNPNNSEAWFLLGDVRMKMDNTKGMMEAFHSSLKINKDWLQKINEEKLHVWGTKINLGVAKYNASKSASKDSVAILIRAAVEAYNDALLTNSDSAITYQNLAIAHMALGETEDEIKFLKLSLERKNDPQFSTFLINAYVTKAEDARKANNKADEEKYFNDAIGALIDARKKDPNNPELLSTLINVYIEAGRASDAMPYIKEAVAKDPQNKIFQNDLGLLLMQTKDIDGAVEHFSAAIAVDSNYTDALRNGSIAIMKAAQQEKDDAMAKADPKTGNVNKAYQKKFLQAAKLLEKYLSIKPDDGPVWQALATAYGGADNSKKALEAIKKADALEKK